MELTKNQQLFLKQAKDWEEATNKDKIIIIDDTNFNRHLINMLEQINQVTDELPNKIPADLQTSLGTGLRQNCFLLKLRKGCIVKNARKKRLLALRTWILTGHSHFSKQEYVDIVLETLKLPFTFPLQTISECKSYLKALKQHKEQVNNELSKKKNKFLKAEKRIVKLEMQQVKNQLKILERKNRKQKTISIEVQ